MILKIKSPDEGGLNGWIFYDSLRKVHSEHTKWHVIKEWELNATWLGKTDGVVDEAKENVLLIRGDRDGEDFSVVTNTATYLLNDDGKTIERIN